MRNNLKTLLNWYSSTQKYFYMILYTLIDIRSNKCIILYIFDELGFIKFIFIIS